MCMQVQFVEFQKTCVNVRNEVGVIVGNKPFVHIVMVHVAGYSLAGSVDYKPLIKWRMTAIYSVGTNYK